jgi:hypothetical protein
MPERCLPLAKPPLFGVVTFGEVERRGVRAVGAVNGSFASIMGCQASTGVWGKMTVLGGDLNQSTTPKSSVELGNEASVTTICWGIKFFYHNL